MISGNVREAKAQLSKLLDLLEEGEDIVILGNGRPVAQLVRALTQVKPRFGAMRGEISWLDGWDKALTGSKSKLLAGPFLRMRSATSPALPLTNAPRFPDNREIIPE
jgi:antitoxin (DNA-binding transcriptional repressor) of toxin-antitoxin stability system